MNNLLEDVVDVVAVPWQKRNRPDWAIGAFPGRLGTLIERYRFRPDQRGVARN